jgi:hypothetical protein
MIRLSFRFARRRLANRPLPASELGTRFESRPVEWI